MLNVSSESELTALQAEWDACMHASMNTTFTHKQEHGNTSHTSLNLCSHGQSK